ncbi:class I SAM-dependent methyltransferase [Streptomyces sp. TRM68416]|uniref:class I SAM-dependent methyltransferase n=1 Tax=Streptomyces sp. TRM68416 TaxID=2758412 RepID=UPI001661CC57|nr:class I SAM-dependent methyltransferase [Streptomyces sp. TRM68416]MBD0843713.1 class I SAM-dependent methyltransferase [Streptomyces sp. TRM68416]
MAHNHAHKHAHHHHDHTDIDWAEMAEHLQTQAELYTPLHEHALAWLGGKQTEPGLIVDAGSGPGVVSCMLADAFPGARVVAVDGSGPLLDMARARAERLGVADRFDTLTGDLPDIMADLDYPADLIWASQSLHHLGDQQAAIKAYAERLTVGGTLALVEGGLPTRFLPRDIGIGRPGLQSRIDAVQEDWFTEMRADLPGSVAVPEDWRALLSGAGLRPSGTRTFLLDLPAPATDRARSVAAATFSRFREVLGDHLDATDLATLDRLVDPDDKASVHHRGDLFVLSARTVHTGVRTG